MACLLEERLNGDFTRKVFIDMTAKNIRLRLMLVVLSSTFLVGASRSRPQKSPPSWFWGCWVVKMVLPTNGISGLSPKQEKAMIGKRIEFTRLYARSGKVVIHSPKYSVKTLSNKEFFDAENYVSLNQIGIRTPSVINIRLRLPINLSDLAFAGNDVYLRKKDIVIVVEGDYFLAERAGLGDPACRCNK